MQSNPPGSQPSEIGRSLREGYLPRIPLSWMGVSIAGYVIYTIGKMAVKSFRPGPQPEMFRDYRHTTKITQG